MAMSGNSKIDVNTKPLPIQPLVYDWLKDRNISWRVYHEGLPFFALMLNWLPEILLDDHFRRFPRLEIDLMNTPPKKVPQVLFLEPTYTDAPTPGPSSDDHPPTAVKGGQAFLFQVYKAFIQVPSLWAETVIIITYDEHGGFFDHVSPIPLITNPPEGANYPPFETSGVRVPALVVSPFVEPGTVYKGVLDHTSILKFIGQVFGKGGYSSEVDKRPVGSVLDVLNVDNPPDTNAASPSSFR
jgi:phospholipase C